MRTKHKKKKLTKVVVLKKFVKTLGLMIEKIPPLGPEGRTCWMLVRDRGNSICCLYMPNYFKIYALGPLTDILDLLFNDIPWWYEIWEEKDNSGTIVSKKRVEFVNPVFGCRSLEEAMVTLDLLDDSKA